MADFVTAAASVHAEQVRRRFRSPEPPRRTGNVLRRVIGHILIHAGERLTGDRRHAAGEAV